MNLRIEIVDSFERFQSLREQWNELVMTTDVDHAYMRHEWFECWIKYFGHSDTLRIVTAWSGDQLVGIAPLHITRQRFRGVPVKLFSFLYSSIAPRCNFILHDNLGRKCFFDEVLKLKGSHLMELRGMQADLKTTTSFLSYLKENSDRTFMIEPGRVAPFTVIGNSWEDYYNRMSKHFKRNIRSYSRRLDEADSFEVRLCLNWQELEPIFDQLIEVSARSWKATEKTDLASDWRLTDFYREFSKLGSKSELWEVYVLFVNGKPTGFIYLLKHKSKRCGIRSDHDSEYNFYMPGTALKAEAIKRFAALSEDIEFDFVGASDKYKSNWTDQLRNHLTVTVNTSLTYGHLLLWAKRTLLPLARHGQRCESGEKCGICRRVQFSEWPQWYCGESGGKAGKVE